MTYYTALSISDWYEAEQRRRRATSYEAYCNHIARYIAAKPATEHRQLVAELLAALRRAGVDVEILECVLSTID